MKKRLFAIPSLLAAGFLPMKAEASMPKPSSLDAGKTKSLFDIFKLDHMFTLAGHRSHSSHSSHSSHRSSAGSYSAPVYRAPSAPTYSAPVYNAPAAASPTYNPPAISAPSVVSPAAPLKVLPGNTERFKEIVQQVQLAMIAFGYYDGDLDGVMGPSMRTGLSKLQADYNLKVTGTITPETLNALRITAD